MEICNIEQFILFHPHMQSGCCSTDIGYKLEVFSHDVILIRQRSLQGPLCPAIADY